MQIEDDYVYFKPNFLILNKPTINLENKLQKTKKQK
jgi:hypothetical protein